MVILLNGIPADTTLEALTGFLAEHGLADAHDAQLLPGDGSAPAASFRLDVSAAEAEAVVKALRGKFWNGSELQPQLLVLGS
ncbi:hypothetical protein [Plasticicumulans acidivorans]|uniref:RNA-binding protein n=1 Tax=Plasticicumulans acidivorans TaxID=886464 RepID=A0A317N084_9GAMM|nr:hypothetical protein [Plasticicumulans acidivorans]PWV65574.1 hypothetical protein C7443_10158 [Plasticicumulans acidivorans]